MKRPPTLLLTPGCPAGIGPEVLVQSLLAMDPQKPVELLYAGTSDGLAQSADRCGAHFNGKTLSNTLQSSAPITCLFENQELPSFSLPGHITEDTLKIQAAALEKAVALAKAEKIDGLITGPIRKSAMKFLGDGFLGHTEYLHAHLATDEHPPLMAFSGGPFLLGLATIHIPLKNVCEKLSTTQIYHALLRLNALCMTLTKKPQPQLVVLGVNPHAGENGLLGHEEKQLLAPVIQKLRTQGLIIDGPISADGFFARFGKKDRAPKVDAVLAMYHDQGLAPYKILAQGEGVNITCGLKVVRTSPDHGTADDIAGKNVAEASAMSAAIQTCLRLLDAQE